MTKTGKQDFMSTATYKCSSSFINAHFTIKRPSQSANVQDQHQHQDFEKKSLETFQDHDSSLENHNCGHHTLHYITKATIASQQYIVVAG